VSQLRSLEYQRVLSALSRLASGTLSVERLMEDAVHQIARVSHINGVRLMRYGNELGDVSLQTGVGWHPGRLDAAKLGREPGREARGRAQALPILLEDPASEHFVGPASLPERGMVSLLDVPIMTGGRIWGVLEADAAEPGNFDEWDVMFLTAVSGMLGICLTRHSAAQGVELDERLSILSEMDLQLRELQHRAKNNLQMIMSCLALQRRNAAADETKDRLDSVMRRIEALALAQEQLAGARGAEVEFGDYLRALCTHICPGSSDQPCEVIATEAMVPMRKAVLAGLVVNELVTNSMKYAFDGGRGTIRVMYALDPITGEGSLAVQDDGKGMPAAARSGLGLSLIEGFARELCGGVEHVPVGRGTCTLLRFPLQATPLPAE
jgi:two-component sensor histidine kinase